MATTILDFLYHHIVLPPQLPQSADKEGGVCERALLDHVIQACRAFRSLSDLKLQPQWDHVVQCLSNSAPFLTPKSLDHALLQRAFTDLALGGGVLLLHVANQNAGIILRKAHADEIVVETFESSPRSAGVLASVSGALEWDFPTAAVTIPVETFLDNEFQKQFAIFLEQASLESIKEFAAVSHKARASAFECRDTVDPALITGMLMALLEALGSKNFPTLTKKRIRDDVCWTDGALMPWRRSPLWLVIRVGLQRALCFLLGGTLGTVHYKCFMAFLLSRLCETLTVSEVTPPEVLANTRSKLARRMIKIQAACDNANVSMKVVCQATFTSFSPGIEKILEAANEKLSRQWKTIQNTSKKPVGRLPFKADPSSLELSLVNSGSYLRNVLSDRLTSYVSTPAVLHGYHRSIISDDSLPGAQFGQRGITLYLELADFELWVEQNLRLYKQTLIVSHEACASLAARIEQYQAAALVAYLGNALQTSLMLLTIMELWRVLDECVIEICSLLAEYSTGFPSDLLYCLQLPRRADMARLKDLEDYLNQRKIKSLESLPSLFGEKMQRATRGYTFAERYFDQSKNLQTLHRDILENAEVERCAKERQWQILSEQYAAIAKEILKSTCLYIVDDDNHLVKVHDDKHCTKCFLQREAYRMRLDVHEHPLPADGSLAKAVVFELDCPQAFAAWRDCTWGIITELGRRAEYPGQPPLVELDEYVGLAPYMITSPRPRITLASTTKSFLNTHYATVRFPVSLEQVCLPNGLRYQLFDYDKSFWTANHTTKPSFAPHCLDPFPTASPFALLQMTPGFAAEANGPSPNDIIASQTRCPAESAILEYVAFQDIRSGQATRWLRLLRELGSTNMNFGAEATAVLVSQSALTAGPNDDAEVHRSSHWVFTDEAFCHALSVQLEERLVNISANWHEGQSMEILLTILLRLYSLANTPASLEEAEKLLMKSRYMLLSWLRGLREEVRNATDADSAKRRSVDAFNAAILCRRTFNVELESRSPIMEPDSLACFVECSIMLQDNSPGNPSKLSKTRHAAWLRDLKMLHRLEAKLRLSIETDNESVALGINALWPEPQGSEPRRFAPWVFLPFPNTHWLTSTTIHVANTRQQTVHYNLLDGTLLVDGQALGKLPDEFCNQGLFQHILGSTTLLAYPSSIPGMTYMLASLIENHQIHFGHRRGVIFMRVRTRHNTVFEYVPPGVFRGPNLPPDLPLPLIDGQCHWLDVNNSLVEIRPESAKWYSKQSNWKINLLSYQAMRRESILVDTRSRTFEQIAMIVEPFETRQEMVIYQPRNGGTTFHLPKLELSFYVNGDGLLQSRQLRAYIDSNQDAGTWYGLDSKLVLRDATNPRERSIIVPMGPVKVQKRRNHVRAVSARSGNYCRYNVNAVLNRLDCPPEPRFIYYKALYHALTSFPLPDPLTGRTGTEEALHCLASGYAQPWTPLISRDVEVLHELGNLTPVRKYYPVDLKVMQNVKWNLELTSTSQSNNFFDITQSILAQSEKLRTFNLTEMGSSSQHLPPPCREPHVTKRARCQAETLGQSMGSPNPLDERYEPTASCGSSSRATRVFEATSTLKSWSRDLAVPQDLAGILQRWPNIGGYEQDLSCVLLDDCLRLDVALSWGAIFTFCQNSTAKDLHKLIFMFSKISFGRNVDMDVMRAFIAFVILDEFKALIPPKWPSYVQFRSGQAPTRTSCLQLIAPSRLAYAGDERQSFNIAPKQRLKLRKLEEEHALQAEKDCETFVDHLLGQWPCLEPSATGLDQSLLLDVYQALERIRPWWQALYHNHDLATHIAKVASILQTCRPGKDNIFKAPSQKGLNYFAALDRFTNPVLSTLLQNPGPGNPSKVDLRAASITIKIAPLNNMRKDAKGPPRVEAQELKSIIAPFLTMNNAVRRKYATDLQQSLDAYNRFKGRHVGNTVGTTQLTLRISELERDVRMRFDSIQNALTAGLPVWFSSGDLIPRVTPVTVLETLRTTARNVFGSRMAEAVLAYSERITVLQRVLRIEAALATNNRFVRDNELMNEGHLGWTPSQYPDWLLLEIDGNIMIRTDQVEVALATIAPKSGENSLLQMNMGQGKSSCVIPMAAAVLADRKKLSRIVVPKPLLLQMAQTLQARLGGLLGRSVRHIPFSRKTPTDASTVQSYYALHREMQQTQGVILSLPEHIMSFKLSGLQRLSNGKILTATNLIKIQTWLAKTSRDVLDESDVTLAVKTQLIYPSGAQVAVDGHPNRWRTIETVLHLVKKHVGPLQRDFINGLELMERPGDGFPIIYFLRKEAEDALIERLTDDICQGAGAILPIENCSPQEVRRVKKFLKDSKFSIKGNGKQDLDVFSDRPAARLDLLLLRGLLVHRILLSCLNKRWNVQYGLHPDRDPIAVPFHAKGVPSPTADWGHPDVLLILTVLSFYFQGLHLLQLKQSLELVLRSDDPGSEYDQLTKDALSLPSTLRVWTAVNLDDRTQCTILLRHLSHNMAVIDYYLNNVVFPQHAKQFVQKLVTSGWDLPLIGTQTKDHAFVRKENIAPGNTKTATRSISGALSSLTTGFSGTNDNRDLLPLTIRQQDLSRLQHTNAEVLTYLLQTRNREYLCGADDKGKRKTELDFLKLVHSRKIRVIIDAGAQVLEMDNEGLVRAWLRVDTEASAAVWFQKDDKPWVCYRDGRLQPLFASPFASNLEGCLVYFDEAHTRGTDLKLGGNAVAALTLGPGQTKDQLVQAAMRLRQLATSQSIVFFAPPEVHHSILQSRQKALGDHLDSNDVIHWLLDQTCRSIELLQPLYISQGMDFCRRVEAATANPDFLKDKHQRRAYLSVLDQQEKQTLEQLYTPLAKQKAQKETSFKDPFVRGFVGSLNNLKESIQDTNNAVQAFAHQEVEQEREVAIEIEVETVREIQKPQHATALPHYPLRREVLSFAENGRLTAGSQGYELAFDALRRTAAGLKHGVNSKAGGTLYVSADFVATVDLPRGQPDDRYERPVNYILWSPMTEVALIISPFEAEALVARLRKIRPPKTHMILYAAPATRRMLCFDKLNFYAVPALPASWTAPAWLTRDLGIYAGRLYFDSKENEELTSYLQCRPPTKTSKEVDPSEDVTDAGQVVIPFTKNPLAFMHDWLTSRRKDQSFSQTPMGQLCQGKRLAEGSLFFGGRDNTMILEYKASDMTGEAEIDENGEEEAVEDVDEDEIQTNDDYVRDDESDEEDL